jgi:predicted branched-subunit amino acid permease
MFRRFYLVTAAVFLSGWMAATAAGLFFGSFLPTSWQLGYAPAVMFIGLVVIGIDRSPSILAAVVGAGVCLATIGLPNRIGLLLGALAGVVAGLVVDLRTSPTQPAVDDGEHS